MLPFSCKVVLVRPRDPNNIGAVARAMKNFGFHDLWIVAPFQPTMNEVTSAPNALDIVHNAQVVPTLAAAIADCELVVGTGDRSRTSDERPIFTPLALSAELAPTTTKMALVFGTERHGLTNEDISHCHRLLTIPTRPNCPSMNLGQSVAVCLYELTRTALHETPPPAAMPNATTTAALVQLAMETLHASEFILPGNEAELTQRVRTGLLKYRLTQYDTVIVCGMLRKMLDRLRRAEQNTLATEVRENTEAV